MKRTNKIAAVILASLSLGLASAGAQAHPGTTGDAMGPGMMGGMMRGMHSMHGGTGPGSMGFGMGGQTGAPMAGHQLMTPEEQTAMREKMHAAATPEERQKLAAANHAEMQKRAKEKGITLPETGGPGRGMGPNVGRHWR